MMDYLKWKLSQFDTWDYNGKENKVQDSKVTNEEIVEILKVFDKE